MVEQNDRIFCFPPLISTLWKWVKRIDGSRKEWKWESTFMVRSSLLPTSDRECDGKYHPVGPSVQSTLNYTHSISLLFQCLQRSTKKKCTDAAVLVIIIAMSWRGNVIELRRQRWWWSWSPSSMLMSSSYLLLCPFLKSPFIRKKEGSTFVSILREENTQNYHYVIWAVCVYHLNACLCNTLKNSGYRLLLSLVRCIQSLQDATLITIILLVLVLVLEMPVFKKGFYFFGCCHFSVVIKSRRMSDNQVFIHNSVYLSIHSSPPTFLYEDGRVIYWTPSHRGLHFPPLKARLSF